MMFRSARAALIATSLAGALTLHAAAAPGTAEAESGPPEVLVPFGAEWRYFPGTADPSAEAGAWAAPAFDDNAWKRGPAGFGYGDNDDRTVLADMQGHYLTVYLRHDFDVAEPGAVMRLAMAVSYDDGFVAYLNGREIARRGLTGTPPRRDEKARDHEAVRPEDVDLPDAAARLVRGRNVLAVEIHNSSLQSSDLSMDLRLVATTTPLVPHGPAVADTPASLPGEQTATVPEEPTSPSARARAWSWRTTAAGYVITNYFEAHHGQAQVEVHGKLVREEATWHPPHARSLVLNVRGEANRVGTLGSSSLLYARLGWERRAQRLELELSSQGARPGYLVAGRILPVDAAGPTLTWFIKGRGHVEWSTWAEMEHGSTHPDPSRNYQDRTFGAAARFLRAPRWLSPQVGLETTERNTCTVKKEYGQRRAFLRVTSAPTSRLWLTVLGRWTERRYRATTGSTAGRIDEQRLARLLLAWQATRHLSVVGFASVEDGTSNRPRQSFETRELWAGLAISH